MKRKPAIRGVPANGEMRDRVRSIVAQLGDKRAAREIGIGRATLSRVLAELPVSAGTFALMREYFDKSAGATS